MLTSPAAVPGALSEHRVRVRLLRVTAAGVVDERGELAAQWEGTCSCGWRCLCWSWDNPWRGAMAAVAGHLEGER